jgi:hypothetical protein
MLEAVSKLFTNPTRQRGKCGFFAASLARRVSEMIPKHVLKPLLLSVYKFSGPSRSPLPGKATILE